ncbi:MAG: cation transporter dimerization domain-containing protein, partial [bacterium]|nr:cation transporter dimerization domain-containing protein [bacterium]
LVPGAWTVSQGHDYIEELEADLLRALPGMRIITHLEPIEDPASYEDIPEGHLPIAPSPGSAGGEGSISGETPPRT